MPCPKLHHGLPFFYCHILQNLLYQICLNSYVSYYVTLFPVGRQQPGQLAIVRDKPIQNWKPRPADDVVRRPRQEQIAPVRFTVRPRRGQSAALASPFMLIYVFAGLIALGTLLLLLPISNSGNGFTPFIDALFTAASAATVTGLVTENTASYWTMAGQGFILFLIFIGGLGMMTAATFLLIMFGQRVTLAQQIVVRDSLQIDQLGGLAKITVRIVLISVAVQVVGFIALFLRFLYLYSPAEAAWQAAFHSISAFNNSGFAIFPSGEGLSAFQLDPATLGIMGTLIFLGSIGYWVMTDSVNFGRFRLFPLTTKLVLVLTVFLIILGTAAFFISEYGNQETLAPLPLTGKISVSVFESISGRTAGFSTVNYSETQQHTNFFFTSLMFTGGASGSVAGGIKVNTLAIILVSILSALRGKIHSAAFGRVIPKSQVHLAMTLGMVAVIFVFMATLLLSSVEADKNFTFMDILFEAISAAGTVGLSTGLTTELSQWGQLILVASMFVGRVGPLTLVLLVVPRGEGELYKFAQERVAIG